VTTPADYADQLERANADAIAFAEACSDEEWGTVVPGENWPVGVVLHHVALGHGLTAGWVDCALAGTAIEGSAEEIDTANARHAEEFAGVGVAETVDLLRANGAAAVAKLRSLDATDLALTTSFGPAGGQPLSIDQYCNAAVRHPEVHLGHAKAAVGRAGAEP